MIFPWIQSTPDRDTSNMQFLLHIRIRPTVTYCCFNKRFFFTEHKLPWIKILTMKFNQFEEMRILLLS